MALEFMDGFDLYSGITGADGSMDDGGWVIDGSFSLDTGRFSGSKALKIEEGGSDRKVRRAFSAGLSTLSVGFAMRINNLPAATSQIMQLEDGSNDVQITLAIDLATRELKLYRGTVSGGTLLGTGTGASLATGTWYYIELELSIANSGGTAKVFIDGGSSALIDFSGDTQEQSGSSASYLVFRIDNEGSITSDVDFRVDDLYVVDNTTRLGEVRITTLYPDGDTATADWLPSSGSDHYAMVDEAQADGDTTYVSTDTLNAEDLYDLEALPVVPDTIHAVQVNVMARKNDAGSRGVTAKMKSGAQTSSGTELSLNADSYQPARVLSETDPDGGGAWSYAAVNSLKAGMELTT